MTSLQSTSSPLVPAKAQSPSRVDSPAQLRRGSLTPATGQLLAKDLEGLRDSINGLHGTLKSSPSLTQLLIRNSDTGQVVAAVGDLIYNGVYYTNYFSEIHVGDPLSTKNPALALFNANTDGSVTIGQNGWLDVLDPFGGNAAWIGTQNDTLVITGAADNGAGLIRLEVAAGVDALACLGPYTVRNMAEAGVPNAQGIWNIFFVDGTHVDLLGSVFSGVFVAPTGTGVDTFSPTIDRGITVQSITDNGAGLIRVRTVLPHNCEDGDTISLAGAGGTPTADGRWVVQVVNATRVDLVDSVFGSGYNAFNSVFLRFFAGMLAQTFAIGDSFSSYKIRAFADGSLKIKNAEITLTSSGGSIVLDPFGPSITLFDSFGSPSLFIEVLTDAPLAITATTNATPDVVTVPGHTFVNGDTLAILNSTGDTAINGKRIVENVVGATFELTDFNGTPINGNGAYTGGGTATRYYAGMLADTIAIGNSFTDYTLRAFADGQLIIKGAVISNSDFTGSFISTAGSGGNILTLTIDSGILTISGTGTEAGLGTITIDGAMTSGSVITDTVLAATSVASASYKSGAATGQTIAAEVVITGSASGTFLTSISVSTTTISYTAGATTATLVTGVSSASGSALVSQTSRTADYKAGLRTA